MALYLETPACDGEGGEIPERRTPQAVRGEVRVGGTDWETVFFREGGGLVYLRCADGVYRRLVYSGFQGFDREELLRKTLPFVEKAELRRPGPAGER